MHIRFLNLGLYQSGWRWSAALATAVLLTVFTGGCLSRSGLAKQSFAFAPAATALTSNTPPTGDRILAIRKLTVQPPFDSPSLIYRTGEFSYEHDYYAGFLVSPADSLAAPIREFFHGNGPFRAVTEPGSALRANVLLEIDVSQLYGDFRKPGQPAAVLGIEFLFVDAPNGTPGHVVSARNFLERVPIQARTPAALMDGWNQALRHVLSNALGDFSSAADQDKAPASLHVSTGSDGKTPRAHAPSSGP